MLLEIENTCTLNSLSNSGIKKHVPFNKGVLTTRGSRTWHTNIRPHDSDVSHSLTITGFISGVCRQMMFCHVQTNIAANYPTEVTVNNKTLNYPRAFPSPSLSYAPSLVKQHSGPSDVSRWSPGRISHTQTALMKPLISFCPLMKPYTTHIHFIKSYRWAFHELLRNTVENDCLAEEELGYSHHTDMVFISSSILTHSGVCESH